MESNQFAARLKEYRRERESRVTLINGAYKALPPPYPLLLRPWTTAIHGCVPEGRALRFFRGRARCFNHPKFFFTPRDDTRTHEGVLHSFNGGLGTEKPETWWVFISCARGHGPTTTWQQEGSSQRRWDLCFGSTLLLFYIQVGGGDAVLELGLGC